jgi:hypothetical protein
VSRIGRAKSMSPVRIWSEALLRTRRESEENFSPATTGGLHFGGCNPDDISQSLAQVRTSFGLSGSPDQPFTRDARRRSLSFLAELRSLFGQALFKCFWTEHCLTTRTMREGPETKAVYLLPRLSSAFCSRSERRRTCELLASVR